MTVKSTDRLATRADGAFLMVIVRRLHRAMAVLVASFVAVHIVNHLAATAGVPQHMAFMKAARLVYRQPLVEPMLLAAVFAQALSGLTLALAGWKARRGFAQHLQAVCGMFLSFFLAVHVSAILYGRSTLHLDTNFYYAAAGMHTADLVWIFAPYYFLSVIALFIHLGCALSWRAPEGVRNPIILASVAVGSTVSLVIVLALAGVLIEVNVPANYKATYGGPAAAPPES